MAENFAMRGMASAGFTLEQYRFKIVAYRWARRAYANFAGLAALCAAGAFHPDHFKVEVLQIEPVAGSRGLMPLAGVERRPAAGTLPE